VDEQLGGVGTRERPVFLMQAERALPKTRRNELDQTGDGYEPIQEADADEWGWRC